MTEKTLAQIRKERIEKLDELRKMGMDPFSYTKFKRTHTAADAEEKYGKLKDGESKPKEKVKICGRVMAIRKHGGSAFIDVVDSTGKIQCWVSKEDASEGTFDILGLLDIGDIIGADGHMCKTKKGQLSVYVNGITVLAKSLRPLPSKSGFKDVEKRYRERYVDLIVNPEIRDVFLKRTKIITSMREFLDKKGFLEVETPVLQPIYGGALAKPFVTHHNALDKKLYLRISDELYLKRLIVGGFERVYEITKDFRNEGIDTRHNPEFTLMEFYCAYIDYYGVMEIVEDMISHIAKDVLGTTKIEYDGKEIDLKTPWKRMTMLDAVKKHTKIDIDQEDLESLMKAAKEKGLKIPDTATKSDIMVIMFEELVQPKLIQPTFIMDYPVEISPLAKKRADDPNFTERFEVFIGGEECGNAFSELNDPIDQKERFEYQMKKKDDEAHKMDEDYVKAMEYGMPPIGGFGVGIDRLTMILTNNPSIREVILFPQLRDSDKKQRFGDKDSDNVK